MLRENIARDSGGMNGSAPACSGGRLEFFELCYYIFI